MKKKKKSFAFVTTECCVLFSFLQAESPQNSSAHTFSFSETILKLWRTTVVFYSLCWPRSRLWNTPRLPNGTISLPLRDYFCRYTLCFIFWFSIAFCSLYLFMKKCVGMSCCRAVPYYQMGKRNGNLHIYSFIAVSKKFYKQRSRH